MEYNEQSSDQYNVWISDTVQSVLEVKLREHIEKTRRKIVKPIGDPYPSKTEALRFLIKKVLIKLEESSEQSIFDCFVAFRKKLADEKTIKKKDKKAEDKKIVGFRVAEEDKYRLGKIVNIVFETKGYKLRITSASVLLKFIFYVDLNLNKLKPKIQ